MGETDFRNVTSQRKSYLRFVAEIATKMIKYEYIALDLKKSAVNIKIPTINCNIHNCDKKKLYKSVFKLILLTILSV